MQSEMPLFVCFTIGQDMTNYLEGELCQFFILKCVMPPQLCEYFYTSHSDVYFWPKPPNQWRELGAGLLFCPIMEGGKSDFGHVYGSVIIN